jgi:DNA polymerase (family 10)
VKKSDVVAALRDLGRFLSLTGERYRARAYERAAANLALVHEEPADLLAADRLTDVPGVGEAVAARIAELLRTGKIRALEKFRKELGAAAGEVAERTGLSGAKLRVLHAHGLLDSTDTLLAAAKKGEVRKVAGFGEKRERTIIERLTAPDDTPAVHFRHEVDAALTRLLPLFDHAVPTGEHRRGEVLPSRVEIVATNIPPRLKLLSATREGDRLDAILPGGLPLRVNITDNVPLTQALTTGDDEHRAVLEARLRQHDGEIPDTSEEAVYRALRLPYSPPERRYGAPKASPRLLEISDIRGAVHCHTHYSDGSATIEDMVRAAEATGFSYITITDHSPTAHYAGGLDVDRLQRQWEEIARVQETTAVRILRGCESDILRDGALDYPDAILERFDVIIASIHQRYRLGRADMTERVVRAMRHPLFKIWGHPLGRHMPERGPIDVDFDAVLDAIGEGRAAIELNGDPYRLDLPPELIERAKGLPFVVSSDAHSTHGLGAYRHSVAMARRGGLQREDVLNTLDAQSFLRRIKPTRASLAATPP